MRRVYLDHNATTPMRPEVREHLLQQIEALGGNPSSVHRSGRSARAVLDAARERTAAALRVHEDEIVFTSGGTESINLAILGVAGSAAQEPGHAEGNARGGHRGLLTSAAEHSAVLGAAGELASRGRRVVLASVDSACRVDPDEILRRASDSASFALVSIMAANNEVGTLQPLAEIGERLARLGTSRPLLHTDAVQALGRVRLDVAEARADLASFSAHKLGGPLGVGLLFKRRGVVLHGIMFGGGQEDGLRPGSENVPAISAASVALELALREREEFEARTRDLSQLLWGEISRTLPDVELLGPPLDAPDRLPNTLDLSIGGVDGRTLVARLDLEGLEASAGSACASGSLEPSHVLIAMGLTPERARAGLRISLGRTTSRDDVQSAVEILRSSVSALR